MFSRGERGMFLRGGEGYVLAGGRGVCSRGGRGVCSRGGRRVWRSSISHLAHNHGLLFILLCLLSERQQTEVSAIASGYIPEYHTVGIAPDTKYTNMTQSILNKSFLPLLSALLQSGLDQPEWRRCTHFVALDWLLGFSSALLSSSLLSTRGTMSSNGFNRT